MSAAAEPVSSKPVPTILEIFRAFAAMALQGFGGVLVWARLILVERKKWMTSEEFNDLFALSQFLPGPNIVNMSVVYGSRLRGRLGAAAALAGLLGPPVVIVTILGIAYAYFADADALRRVLAGIAAAGAGLLIATTVKMAHPLFRNPVALVFLALTFVAVGIFRFWMPAALVVLVPLSVGAAWWVRR